MTLKAPKKIVEFQFTFKISFHLRGIPSKPLFSGVPRLFTWKLKSSLMAEEKNWKRRTHQESNFNGQRRRSLFFCRSCLCRNCETRETKPVCKYPRWDERGTGRKRQRRTHARRNAQRPQDTFTFGFWKWKEGRRKREGERGRKGWKRAFYIRKWKNDG